jgi:ubiquitin carboxyl-terminal hydrolase L3
LVCLPMREEREGKTDCSVEEGTDLSKLIQDAITLAPLERADLLYNSKALEHAHANAASQGQSSAPDAEDAIDLHYVCFVKSPTTNHLWELDGRRKGPINLGVLGAEDDVLSEKALELGVRRFIKREEEAGGGELRFSLVTLAPTLD